MSLSRIFAGLLVIAGAGAMAMPVRAADDDTRVIMMTMRVFQLKVDARDDGGHASVPVLKDLPIVAALEGDAVRLVVAGTEIDGFLHEQAKHRISVARSRSSRCSRRRSLACFAWWQVSRSSRACALMCSQKLEKQAALRFGSSR